MKFSPPPRLRPHSPARRLAGHVFSPDQRPFAKNFTRNELNKPVSKNKNATNELYKTQITTIKSVPYAPPPFTNTPMRRTTSPMRSNPESQWFGEEAVTPDEKTRKVIGVFDSVAKDYDRMNDFMSGGLHRLWKDHLIRKIRPRAGLHYLDVAGGTGDIAFRIRQKAGANCRITLCDLNTDMLRVGRDRAFDHGFGNDFEWVTGNAESLPLPDGSVDVYTISFGLRNVTHIDTALAEAARVLKPGGRFFCLEFSHVDAPILRRIYDAYSYAVIPTLGQMVAKDRESYQYLVESIRKFPRPEALKRRALEAGFKTCRFERLTFGVVALHEAVKI